MGREGTMEVEMKIRGLMMDPVTNMPIVILKDVAGDSVLPIWVGIYEANAIALEIEKVTTPRPMTHDLLKNVLTGLDTLVHKVVVTELREDTFFAVIWLERDGRILLNSRHPRRWPHNLLRDPRVAIAIPDVADPLRWLGITGVVDEVVEDLERARDDIVAMARRYSEDGTVDPQEEALFRGQPRITFLVRITGIHDHLGG